MSEFIEETVLKKHIKDDCEFVLSQHLNDDGNVSYSVECWKKDEKGEYTLSHWYLLFKDKGKSELEYNRWC